ncbi:MAG: aminotransferase class I/II-fold pyridoxal phosphate-dependent enzyme [Planctomycetes bacterium]|nr:aminotransferase class I/II-fold pyridoxal phosphate-dependent enzyme [Planctomycetota bacterium]
MAENDKISSNDDEVDMSTFLIHGKFVSPRWDYKHHLVPPISSSVTYRLDSAERGGEGFVKFGVNRTQDEDPVYIYDRLDEPTRGMLEEGLAQAENADMAVTFSTGMAAIAAAFGVTMKAGDHLVAFRTIYGCTFSLITNWLPRLGIEHTLVDFGNLDEVKAAINDNTKVFYFETPANPTLEFVDLEAIIKIRDEINKSRDEENHIKIIVDNTFATPFAQRPLDWGVDIVIHSLTKNIGGFGTDMGGAVVGACKYESDLLLYRKDFGGALAPKTAWNVLVYGLSTLPLRMERQQKTALEVAKFLESHPKIAKVHYPGLDSFPWRDLAKKQLKTQSGEFAPGSMIYFETKETDLENFPIARNMIDWIATKSYSITLAVSLGNIRTLIESPGLMTHAAIPPEEREKGSIAGNGIRISIGIEQDKDIIKDLKAALDQA